MESYAYPSSYPDSGDSSPRSREIECETAAAAAAWDELPPPCARVKLMCSYGGRIQPRSHDNLLSYVGGDTKILAVDRSVRYPSIIAKLAAFCGSDDVILKYQLPGEDLDALISVTNDEDLEHMMIEYDRLHRSGSKPVPRLRLFLFAAGGKTSQDRPWFADSPSKPVTSPSPKDGPDFLFGLDKGFVPPPAVKVKEPAVENGAVEPVSARSEQEPVISPAEMQRLQIADNNKQQQQQQKETVPIPKIGGDETLTRVCPSDYYVHQVQEKPPAPAPAPVPAAYWPDHQRSVAPAARFASIVSGDQQFYLIPANSGVFQAGTAPGQGYYTTVQRVVPAGAYDGTAGMYGVAPPQPVNAAAYDSGLRAHAVEVSAGYGAPPASVAYDNGAGYAAYDSSGRAVYYAGGAPATYQTVGNVAIAAESKVLKPSQVS